MDISELHDLPTNKKIELVFQLWDEIASSQAPIQLSSSVIAEIDRRCSEIDADPSILLEEEELWRQVDEK